MSGPGGKDDRRAPGPAGPGGWRRLDSARPRARSVDRASVVVALLIGMALVGAWACGPRAAAPVSAAPQPVAAQALLAPAPLPAPEPPAEDPHVARLVELEAALAKAMAEAADARAARDAAELARASSAAMGFPVSSRLEMSSTAYCLKGNMRTGVRTRDGMAAGDPRVLPLGSVVRVTHPDGRLIGIFVVMDTGGAIKGNKIDIYMDDCGEAIRWGRRPVIAEVLDTGRA